MSSKIQFLTLDTGEATALCKKFQKMNQNLSKINAFFLSLFHFLSGYFDMDSRYFGFVILKNKTNVKLSLHKNFEHWHHIEANLSVTDIIEND